MIKTIHFFDTDIAKEYGIPCAILLGHLAFWVEKNKANDKNMRDGYYWTYNSIKAMETMFPYMSKNTIIRSLEKLEKEGLIKTSNYNENVYDRTKWYTLTELGESILPKSEIHLPKVRNEITQSQKPIPDNIPDNNIISVSKDTDCQTDVRQSIQKAVDAWNELEPYGYSKISRMSTTSTRYKMLKARIAEYGIEDIITAIENVKNSNFLKNAAWFSFDWFVKPNNFPKVLEGNYKNKTNVSDSFRMRTGTDNGAYEFDVYGNRRQ